MPRGNWWRNAHRYNAIFLFAFIIVHMLTHLSGLFGIDAYNSVQAVFRIVYRNIVVESLLLFAVTAQLVVGLRLVVRRLRIKEARGFWGWLQIVSGIAFFLFMAQHLFSLGMTRLYFDLDTNFYWPASVMSGPWFAYYFWPYYIIGVFAVFAHLGAGARFSLRRSGRPEFADRMGISFLLVGAVIALTIPPIIGGLLFPIELPAEWIDYLQFYMPNFKPW